MFTSLRVIKFIMYKFKTNVANTWTAIRGRRRPREIRLCNNNALRRTWGALAAAISYKHFRFTTDNSLAFKLHALLI